MQNFEKNALTKVELHLVQRSAYKHDACMLINLCYSSSLKKTSHSLVAGE